MAPSTDSNSIITVELWSFGRRPQKLEGSTIGPIPSDLQNSAELIVDLRYLTSTKNASEAIQNSDGRDKIVKRYLSNEDDDFNNELLRCRHMIEKILQIRSSRGTDRKKTLFRFGFSSQEGRHRSVAFVGILAKNLLDVLQLDKYRIVINHYDLDDRIVLPMATRKKSERIVPDKVDAEAEGELSETVDLDPMEDDPLDFRRVQVPDDLPEKDKGEPKQAQS